MISAPGALGRGGMESKLRCAVSSAAAGVTAAMVDGCQENALVRLMAGEDIGTVICPLRTKLKGNRRWLSHGPKVKGSLVLDDGAVRAVVHDGKSLLPSGILDVEGEFRAGDVVACVSSEGTRIAKGLTSYASAEIKKIQGRRSQDLEKILGHKGYPEVIHRDDMVLQVPSES